MNSPVCNVGKTLQAEQNFCQNWSKPWIQHLRGNTRFLVKSNPQLPPNFLTLSLAIVFTSISYSNNRSLSLWKTKSAKIVLNYQKLNSRLMTAKCVPFLFEKQTNPSVNSVSWRVFLTKSVQPAPRVELFWT